MKSERTATAEGSWAVPLSEVRKLVEASAKAPDDAMVTVVEHKSHPVDSINAEISVTWEEA